MKPYIPFSDPLSEDDDDDLGKATAPPDERQRDEQPSREQRHAEPASPSKHWRVAALILVAVMVMGGLAVAAWQSGIFQSRAPMTDALFSDRLRTIAVASELRQTVSRKMELDRAYLIEAQERQEEQMALTFQMSVSRAIDDYRNAGSNWTAALLDLHADFVHFPEQTQARLESATAALSNTQTTTRAAFEKSLQLLTSVPADLSPEQHFARALIEEPNNE